jgi:hypothetical protein
LGMKLPLLGLDFFLGSLRLVVVLQSEVAVAWLRLVLVVFDRSGLWSA